MKWTKSALKLTLLLLLPLLTLNSCDDDDPQPDTATIHGTITFENVTVWDTWQDSGEVQVTIFPEFSLNPPAGWGDIPDDTFGPGVPGGRFAIGAPYNAQNPVVLTYVPGQSEYHYSIEVEPGTYSALAVGFRHDLVQDPSLRTATLGVHWGNESQVSHGVVIKAVIQGNIVTLLDYPAPTAITVDKGDNVEINFTADFDFVNTWY